MHAEVGAEQTPELDVAMDMDCFFAIASGDLEPREALAQGHLQVRGEPDTLARCLAPCSASARASRRRRSSPS